MSWRPVEPALGAAIDWRRCLRLGAVGALVSLVLVVMATVTTPAPAPHSRAGGYTVTYTPPHSRFEVLLNHADGQAYATLAQDPSLSHPELFVQGAVGAAPFLPRPLLPYLLWASSLGRRQWLPAAFTAVEALAGGLLVLAAAALLQGTGRRRDDRLALATLALPGTLIALFWLGQDVLALGLALLGVVAWCGSRPRWLVAGLLFVAAGLTRETMLVVVAGVALYSWASRGFDRRDVVLGLPFVAYVAWSTFASARYGLRTGRGLTYNLAFPLSGLIRAIPGWSLGGALVVLLTFVLAGWALIRPRNPLLSWLLVAFLVASTISAERVWDHWESGIRVILPVAVLALLDLRLPRVIAALVESPVESAEPAEL